MDKILIVGYGVTGYNMLNELLGLAPDIYDINKEIKLPARQHSEYDFIFICVDTPYIDETNPCDISQIKNAINEWKPYLTTGGVFVIKSTILPSLTDTLSELNVPIVYSPEYYGNTQHCNNFEFNFTILGGEGSYPYKIQQLLQKVKDARHTFRVVDAKTACLAKYMENCYLAMKVSFCSQFFDIAKENDVNYEDLRELFILDPRVNPSHTFVYRDKPYWDSHCLNKDVRAIAETQNAELLKNIINFNNNQKNNMEKDRIERMKTEKAELETRTTKLLAFMESAEFETLDNADKRLLRQQYCGMEVYLTSLRARLLREDMKRFETDIKAVSKECEELKAQGKSDEEVAEIFAKKAANVRMVGSDMLDEMIQVVMSGMVYSDFCKK